MTVGFGQGAVSVSLPPECSADRSSSTVASHSSADANLLTPVELGLGGKVPFSAAKPTRLTALDECEVIEYVTNDSRNETHVQYRCSSLVYYFYRKISRGHKLRRKHPWCSPNLAYRSRIGFDMHRML
jgi:hypothetical protein